MPPQISSQQDIHLIPAGNAGYTTLDGRFHVENTWSPASNREPNWLLVDQHTGRNYRFFVLCELGNKVDELSGIANPGAKQDRQPA